eukprot:gnl/TRDRNA2_/TRDRNA2_177577_c0_seq21.p1 gnl/TRDRNA2_/TRDRNA2_177577_c0~~gnl/TRDRNA2_/TRDRNA2_177577_c0_seq21.p1  ORF type:complete len:337 (-),score=10.94 gnl/TRDRNA2_/TRDRNA2_177577_c0_seq21:243-1166(-)
MTAIPQVWPPPSFSWEDIASTDAESSRVKSRSGTVGRGASTNTTTDRDGAEIIAGFDAMAMTRALHTIIDNIIMASTKLEEKHKDNVLKGLLRHGSLPDIDEAMHMFTHALEPLKEVIKGRNNMRLWRLVSLFSELRLATEDRCSGMRMNTSRTCKNIWSGTFWHTQVFSKFIMGPGPRTPACTFPWAGNNLLGVWQYVLLELLQIFYQYDAYSNQLGYFYLVMELSNRCPSHTDVYPVHGESALVYIVAALVGCFKRVNPVKAASAIYSQISGLFHVKHAEQHLIDNEWKALFTLSYLYGVTSSPQ